MATYKVLGTAAPSATTNVDLYTVPPNTQTAVSTITVCNRGASSAAYRIAVRPVGASIASNHYLAYDTAVPANQTTTITIGITLGASDIITVYASTANVTFLLFGVENP